MPDFTDSSFLSAPQRFAGSQCLVGAGLCLVLAALFLLRASRPGAAYILAILGIAEVLISSRQLVTSFSLAATVPAEVRQFLAAHPGDYRILNLSTTTFGPFQVGIWDSALAMGANDISGYDPVLLQRYEQFAIYSQGGKPADSPIKLTFGHASRLLRLLRLAFVLQVQGHKLGMVETPGSLPHLLLVSGWSRFRIATGFWPL